MADHKLERAALLLVPVAVAVVTFLCFSPAIDAEFLDFDDNLLLLANTEWRGFAWENVAWMFTAFRLGQYQPVTWLSYAVDHHFWGLDPRGYHLTNVALHSVNGVLLYLFVLQCQGLLLGPTKRSPRLLACASAALATLFFAIHPMRVESVAWVTERRDGMSLLFLLLAVIAFSGYYRRFLSNEPKRWPFYVSAWVAFSVSLLCKAIGMTIPVVLLLFMFYVEHRRGVAEHERPNLRTRLLLLAPFVLCAIGSAAVAFVAQQSVDVGPLAQGGMRTLEEHSYFQRVSHAAYGFLYYPIRTLVPYRLSALYAMPLPFDAYTARFLMSVVAMGILLFVATRYWRRYPGVAFAFVAYGLIISPVVGLTHVGIQLVADRYSYHSLVPLVPLLSIAMLELNGFPRPPWTDKLRRAFAACVAFALLIVLGWSTASYASKWKDDVTLWSWCIEAQPSYGTYFQRASAYLKQGRLDLALADAEKAVEDAPTHFNGWLMQAGIHTMKGNRAKALQVANRLVFLDDDTGVGYNERGKIRYALRRYEEAATDFAEALRREPEFAEAAVLLGQSLFNLGRYEEAIASLERADRLGAERQGVLLLLAAARFKLAELDAALEAVEQALESDASDPELHLMKGRILLEQGDLLAAREALTAALEEAPDDWPARAYVESLLEQPSD